MCTDSGDLWCSSDTSRCVAEKKYTEQQAKKLFPQVFVPVCNPDGTYSEVTKSTPWMILVLNTWCSETTVEKSNYRYIPVFARIALFSCMNLIVNDFELTSCLHAILITGSVPQLHWILLVCHPQWQTHQWLSSGQ